MAWHEPKGTDRVRRIFSAKIRRISARLPKFLKALHIQKFWLFQWAAV